MQWKEQSEQMMRSWTEAQKKIWGGWVDAAQKTGPSWGPGGEWKDWTTQWQETAKRSLEFWTRGIQGTPREVAGRLLTGEEAYFRFIEVALGILKTLAPKIDAGGDWSGLLRKYVEQMKAEMLQSPAPWFTPESTAAVARDVPELWKLYTAQVRDLATPWMESLREAKGHVGEAMGGDRKAAIKTFNVFMDTFEGTLGKFTAAPAIGYTREFQEKLTRTFEAWVDVRRAEVEFRTEVVNIGMRAVENTVRELVERGERGEKIESYRELFDLWVSIAEKAFYDMASTESFAEVQARLVNTGMHYRIHERELAEEYLRAMHLPTRSELDDAYRALHDLRGEVKALKKSVVRLQAGATPPTPSVAPATATAPESASKAARPRATKPKTTPKTKPKTTLKTKAKTTPKTKAVASPPRAKGTAKKKEG